jgi:hypothetical protein
MNADHKAQWNKLGLSMVLLFVGLLLFVGVTWSRYRTQLQADLQYTPHQSSQIYLWGERTENGGFSQLPDTWRVENGTYEVPFTVTNGIAGKDGQADLFASKDLGISVRIAVTDGIRDPGNFSVQLRLNDAQGTFYQGVAEKIQEDSPLYSTFGDGWVYTFHTTEGKEPRWTLNGGSVSSFEATLIYEVQSDTIDYSMMQMQVVADG